MEKFEIDLRKVFHTTKAIPFVAGMLLQEYRGTTFHPTKACGHINYTSTVRGHSKHFAKIPENKEELYEFYILSKLQEAGCIVTHFLKDMDEHNFVCVMITSYGCDVESDSRSLKTSKTLDEQKKFIICATTKRGDEITRFSFDAYFSDKDLQDKYPSPYEEMESDFIISEHYDFSMFEESDEYRLDF